MSDGVRVCRRWMIHLALRLFFIRQHGNLFALAIAKIEFPRLNRAVGLREQPSRLDADVEASINVSDEAGSGTSKATGLVGDNRAEDLERDFHLLEIVFEHMEPLNLDHQFFDRLAVIGIQLPGLE